MVRAGGFEPPTAWFVARYSIQLSYARTVIFSDILFWQVIHLKCNAFKVSIFQIANGARGRIRTSDRLVRSQVLYPAELRAHRILHLKHFTYRFNLMLKLN